MIRKTLCKHKETSFKGLPRSFEEEWKRGLTPEEFKAEMHRRINKWPERLQNSSNDEWNEALTPVEFMDEVSKLLKRKFADKEKDKTYENGFERMRGVQTSARRK
jgi:hypothetical protein